MMSALAQQAARLHGEALRPLLRRRMRPGAPVSHGAAHRHEGGVFGAGAPMHAAALAAAISADRDRVSVAQRLCLALQA